MLTRHDGFLTTLFECVAGKKEKDDLAGRSHRLLDHGEWLAFLRSFEVLGADVTARDASRCFAWSRMRVVDEVRATTGPSHKTRHAGTPLVRLPSSAQRCEHVQRSHDLSQFAV